MTIRIPEKSFDPILLQIQKMGQLFDKTVYSSDVTEEILDLEARIQTSKAVNGGVNSQTSEMLAQQEALKMRSRMSTISLVLQQKPNALLSSGASASWTGDTWNAALSSALGAFRILGACAIWLLVYSPIWGSVVLLAWYLHRQKRKTTASI